MNGFNTSKSKLNFFLLINLTVQLSFKWRSFAKKKKTILKVLLKKNNSLYPVQIWRILQYRKIIINIITFTIIIISERQLPTSQCFVYPACILVAIC